MVNHAIIRILQMSYNLSLGLLLMNIVGCGFIVMTELGVERAVNCYMQCAVWMLLTPNTAKWDNM